ncbi:Lipase 1 [Pseudocercospora fuligena]|uniref:Carboxylic ester hydrolase n=1 Tax=Pseudocercospora fuligena TaxID=685502 RepID=A0A8H6RU18_9PEZI|nr:Lipase 1 [Pseudocercospora fuligena]
MVRLCLLNRMRSACMLLVILLSTPIQGRLQYNTSGTNPIIDLGYAQYKGTHNSTSGINTWYGLRYAQAPVGELRWQAPMDIESKNDYNPLRLLMHTESEDCLLLDVLVPAKPASSNLPVMVQIHGGGYTTLSAASNPGNALVYQSQENLIYVAIQYRLGALGFLGGSQVLANGAANAGLLDQRAALIWVQRHIGKFGGDPSKVTIIGGSAGGGAVVNHMMLYGGVTNPPFRAVIAEYPWMQPYHNSSTLERQFGYLCEASGCKDLECLRELPLPQLRNATDKTYMLGYQNGDYGHGDYYFGPYIDGNIIRDLPSNEFKQGRFTKVPFLTSREGYEGYFFTNMTEERETPAGLTRTLENLFPYAKQSFFSRLFQLYPRENYNSTLFQHSAIFGDFIIACPSTYIAAAVSDWELPVWKYSFYAGSQTHGAILPFVETVSLEGDSNNATLASILRNYYISFVVSLDPNAVKFTSINHANWPRYQAEGIPSFKILNITYSTVQPSDDLDVRPQCDFFHSQSYVVRN